jgi:ABC-2 type transport system permease protein
VAETDLSGYRRFLLQAEAYRYALIQKLNWLQASAVKADDDAAKGSDAAAEARSRVSAQHWRQMPQFRPTRPAAAEVIGLALPALAILAAWLAAALVVANLAAQRLTRSAA